MTTSGERTATRRLLAGLLAAATIATLVIATQQRHRAAVRQRDPAAGQINDLDRWVVIAPTFVRDRVDYVNDELPTPPISLLVLAPLAALGRPNAQFAWACLKLPIVCLAFAVAMAIVRRAGAQLTPPAIALMVAGWFLAVVVDMQEGQINFLALLPLAAGLYAAQAETTASSIAAGILIGLGIAMKVTPLVFVLYFVWRKRWVVAAATLVAVVLWSLIPAVAFGWDQNRRWLGQWARLMIVPYIAEGKVVYATSQSIGSFALRLLTDMPAFDSHRHGIVESHYMNVASLSQATVHQIVRALMVGVGAAGIWWTRRPLRSLKSPRYVVEIGAVSAFMLWFSERTWIPHYVSFVLTLAAAGMIMSDVNAPARLRELVRWALIVFAVVTLSASEVGRALGPDGVDWAKAAGVYLWPSVLVTLTTVMATMAGGRTDEVDGVS